MFIIYYLNINLNTLVCHKIFPQWAITLILQLRYGTFKIVKGGMTISGDKNYRYILTLSVHEKGYIIFLAPNNTINNNHRRKYLLLHIIVTTILNIIVHEVTKGLVFE